ncbi:hypothetical protein ACIP5T_17270 [Microbacterium sp. NPDC088619]|uniref:hypothetical protein n=1 Tax=Microbacterium sp. NPDC088619 TaxID=3364196 RepID=UPI00382A4B77
MSKRWRTRRPEGIAPDDPEYLLNRFLPTLRPHIINNYAWMERRGNCLISVEDLTQLAAIELMKLIKDWPDILARDDIDTTRDTDPLFFHFLKHHVKQQLQKVLSRKGTDPETVSLEVEYEGQTFERDDLYDDRTSLRRRPDGEHWPATYGIIMDFWDNLAPVDKMWIALRHFDELSRPHIKTLMGKDTAILDLITKRWRAHARNQILDHEEEVEPRKARPWEPPEQLLEYLRTRHGKDMHEYLGIVTICFRQDSGYLCRALDMRPHHVGTAKISPEQIAMIDLLRSQGRTHKEIAAVVGISKSGVGARLTSQRRGA